MASRRSDLRILCSGAIAAALTFAASGAAAQAPGQSGLRTLSWPGKAESPRAEQQAPAARAAATPESAPPQVQPSVLPDYTAATPAFPRGLTPATAFGAPAVARGGAAYASTPTAYQPAPAPTVQAAATAPVVQTPVPSTAVPQTALPQTPVASPRTQPTPADDPMAPRADAPVWRLMGAERTDAAPAPVPANGQGPGAPQPVDSADRDGARYYSVHRQAGRAPDPTTLPAPFFLDSAPVDLAEPPPPPTLVRQGGLAPSVADTGL